MGRASGSMMSPTSSYSFKFVGAGASCLLLGPPGSNWWFSFAPELVSYFAPRDLLLNLLSPRFLFIRMFIMIYLFVFDDSLTS